MNVGLTISIPAEDFDNRYVTRELSVHFHYFFMRKFWFAYLAKAVIVFPGGFGTLDELFELLTLVQTHKMRKAMPIVLFGTEYWREIVDFDALVRHGTISPGDVDLVYRTDSVDEAYGWIVSSSPSTRSDSRGRCCRRCRRRGVTDLPWRTTTASPREKGPPSRAFDEMFERALVRDRRALAGSRAIFDAPTR